MMTNDKQALLKQMEEQRFQPITEETLTLYDNYNAIIDAHNPDELSSLLFYKGEYYYRIGNFIEALKYLSRCLQAPKHDDCIRFDALSYNIMGLIYAHLRQECVAINNLLRGKSISDKHHLIREFAVCSSNMGNVYSQLEDFETAIRYYHRASEHLVKNHTVIPDVTLRCEVCCGILYCKANDREKALQAYETITKLKEENHQLLFDAAVFNFYVRLYDFLQDDDFLHDAIDQLFTCISDPLDFLEDSNFYFDTFDYLLKKHMQPEALALLTYIGGYAADSPLVFLNRHYVASQVGYAQAFSNHETYLARCSDFINIQMELIDEQRTAKLYSLEHIERIRQTKNDSEMYREKSQLDQMTGLLNKYTIQFLVEEDLALPHAGKQAAMILIDMDHFKQINDTLGHLTGDTFICQTASIIQDYFKEKAFCGRVGGDEFLVYIPNVTDPSFVILQSEILRQEIYRKTSERNITITTQASIGIAFSSEYCYDYESLFNMADQALYRAKLEGRNKVVVSDQKHSSRQPD